MLTKNELIEFETEIGNTFNEGKIKAPIHLYSGNEELIMDVFKEIDIEKDWVCCTWRNHYQGLLKGIPQEVLRENIMDGKSMVMNLPA
jgi:pyruvate dehydrogenase E1 component alpha subunit